MPTAGPGFKLTPQRMAILDYLKGNTGHPSAEEIHRKISRSFPTLSLATVYNTLDALKRKGMITELTLDPAKKRFDPNTARHHHLVCIGCKTIVDIRTAFTLTVPRTERKGFEIMGNHIEFCGLCPVCRQKEKSRKKGECYEGC